MHPTNRRIAPPQLPPDALESEAKKAAEAAENKPDSHFRKIVPFVRGTVGAILIAGVALGVAWSARQYVLTSPRFAVTHIEVVGAKMRSNDELSYESTLAIGQNIFSIDLDLARAAVAKDPWIHDVEIARRLPGTILLSVTEREAAAIVAVTGADGASDAFLASHDGEMFKRLEVGDPSDLIVVTGITQDAIAQDRDGVTRSILRALDLASDYSHTRLAAHSPLEEIHLGRDGTTSIVIGKNALTLTLGAPPFRKKLDQASRVLAEVEKRGGKADVVLLDNDTRPDRVVVRMR
ncbi:MAG: FtsQ-type POTRA domain-containing protein [Polyangiaceae bacterium]